MSRPMPHRMPRLAPFLAAILLIVLGTAQSLAHAQATDDISLEHKVKAASIYRFLAYVDWPPAAFSSPNAPYVIGIAGAPDIAEELARISVGRNVNNRGLTVRQVRPGDSLAGLHALYISADADQGQSRLLAQAEKRNILTITEDEDSPPPGSIINFRLVQGRVRFEVSLPAAARNGLKVSSRLLPVAVAVYGGAPS